MEEIKSLSGWSLGSSLAPATVSALFPGMSLNGQWPENSGRIYLETSRGRRAVWKDAVGTFWIAKEKT